MDGTSKITLEGDFVQVPETFVHGPVVDATEYIGAPPLQGKMTIERSEPQLAEQKPE